MVSVIVPIYNVEQWLDRCIQSIMCQSHKDWELILVDDGSQDGSLAICEKYAGVESRIRLVSKPNGGVGSARNVGMDMAQGEWIVFVDSDDYVEADYLEQLVKRAAVHACDHAIMGYTHHYQGETIEMPMRAVVCEKHNLGDGFKEQEWRNFNYVWGKLFRAEVIRRNGMRFDETLKICEDYLFMIEYITYVESMVFVPKCSYHYVRRDGSLSVARRCLDDTLRVHLRQSQIFERAIEGRTSSNFEHFIGIYIVEVLEIAIKMLYAQGDTDRLSRCISRKDICRFRRYKKCCSWKEWMLKQTLSFGLLRLYAWLALMAERKNRNLYI